MYILIGKKKVYFERIVCTVDLGLGYKFIENINLV